MKSPQACYHALVDHFGAHREGGLIVAMCSGQLTFSFYEHTQLVADFKAVLADV